MPRAHVGSVLCNTSTDYAEIVSACDLSFHDAGHARGMEPEQVALDRQFLYSVYIHAPPHVQGTINVFWACCMCAIYLPELSHIMMTMRRGVLHTKTSSP